MNYNKLIKDLYLKRVEVQERKAETYADEKRLQEEEKQLWKMINETIRESNGDLTLEKLLK